MATLNRARLVALLILLDQVPTFLLDFTASPVDEPPAMTLTAIKSMVFASAIEKDRQLERNPIPAEFSSLSVIPTRRRTAFAERTLSRT